jgi:hypothetical protein
MAPAVGTPFKKGGNRTIGNRVRSADSAPNDPVISSSGFSAVASVWSLLKRRDHWTQV